ncbi:MAG: hypothetical protein Q8K65_12460 [Alphaproteobacteria bacterium]|nr:hypothetical protein [Alphaproteobacteria bacterium]
MIAFRTMGVLLAAVGFVAFFSYASPALAQSAGQKMRAENLKAQQGAKRSFELDLSKMSSKRPQSQRTAGAVQKEWKKNHRVRNDRRTQGKRNMTRDQKNYGALNR